LKDEVATLSRVVRERDEALSNASREIEMLRATVRDRDEALQALEKTCGELRDEVVGWQTHSEGELLATQWPWCRGPRLALI
jgi:prefoldin subunit 5